MGVRSAREEPDYTGLDVIARGDKIAALYVFLDFNAVVRGTLIVLGLLTRPGLPAINMGEAALLYCFIVLYLAAAGPGPWSIDRD